MSSTLAVLEHFIQSKMQNALFQRGAVTVVRSDGLVLLKKWSVLDDLFLVLALEGVEGNYSILLSRRN